MTKHADAMRLLETASVPWADAPFAVAELEHAIAKRIGAQPLADAIELARDLSLVMAAVLSKREGHEQPDAGRALRGEAWETTLEELGLELLDRCHARWPGCDGAAAATAIAWLVRERFIGMARRRRRTA